MVGCLDPTDVPLSGFPIPSVYVRSSNGHLLIHGWRTPTKPGSHGGAGISRTRPHHVLRHDYTRRRLSGGVPQMYGPGRLPEGYTPGHTHRPTTNQRHSVKPHQYPMSSSLGNTPFGQKRPKQRKSNSVRQVYSTPVWTVACRIGQCFGLSRPKLAGMYTFPTLYGRSSGPVQRVSSRSVRQVCTAGLWVHERVYSDRATPPGGQRSCRTQRRLSSLPGGHPPLLIGSPTVLVVVASMYQSSVRPVFAEQCTAGMYPDGIRTDLLLQTGHTAAVRTDRP